MVKIFENQSDFSDDEPHYWAYRNVGNLTKIVRGLKHKLNPGVVAKKIRTRSNYVDAAMVKSFVREEFGDEVADGWAGDLREKRKVRKKPGTAIVPVSRTLGVYGSEEQPADDTGIVKAGEVRIPELPGDSLGRDHLYGGNPPHEEDGGIFLPGPVGGGEDERPESPRQSNRRRPTPWERATLALGRYSGRIAASVAATVLVGGFAAVSSLFVPDSDSKKPEQKTPQVANSIPTGSTTGGNDRNYFFGRDAVKMAFDWDLDGDGRDELNEFVATYDESPMENVLTLKHSNGTIYRMIDRDGKIDMDLRSEARPDFSKVQLEKIIVNDGSEQTIYSSEDLDSNEDAQSVFDRVSPLYEPAVRILRQRYILLGK